MIKPSAYDDGLDADGYPLNEPWRKPYKRGDESGAGDFQAPNVGAFLPIVLERARQFSRIADVTDSLIEDMLGAALLMRAKALRIDLKLSKDSRRPPGEGPFLVPQFRWGRIYRSDWAIVVGDLKGVLLIECDGKEFHSSPAQIEHDRKKDQAARDRGWFTWRFTGSQINVDADGIAKRILDAITE